MKRVKLFDLIIIVGIIVLVVNIVSSDTYPRRIGHENYEANYRCFISSGSCNGYYDKFDVYQYPKQCPDFYVYDKDYKLVKVDNFCCGNCKERYCCADPNECLNQYNCELPWWLILLIVLASCTLILVIAFIVIRYYCLHREYSRNKNREVVVLPRTLKHYSDDIINRSHTSLKSSTSSVNRKPPQATNSRQQQQYYRVQTEAPPTKQRQQQQQPQTQSQQQQQQLSKKPQPTTYTQINKPKSLRTIKSAKSTESNK